MTQSRFESFLHYIELVFNLLNVTPGSIKMMINDDTFPTSPKYRFCISLPKFR